MELYRVSFTTASRWVDSGNVDQCLSRHIEREQGAGKMPPPKPRASDAYQGDEIRAIMAEHRVSYATAYRWLRSGDVEVCVKLHRERAQLREDCARNGVPMRLAHTRRHAGVPLEECGAPIKRAGRGGGR
jgi:hypothetical protein